MNHRYDILKSISQGKDGAMPPENADLVHIANDICRAAGCGSIDEAELTAGSGNVTDLNEAEKRAAEAWAKKCGRWTPIADIFCYGMPGPSGSESDTFLSADGYVYKMNNLMHCADSIVLALSRFILFNTIFPDSAYTFIAFAGFSGRSVYPVVRQRHIKNSVPATQNEIDCYMAAIGFQKISNGRYENANCVVWDVLPKNVLKDTTGDFFVIDAEISYK